MAIALVLYSTYYLNSPSLSLHPSFLCVLTRPDKQLLAQQDDGWLIISYHVANAAV